ncbi:beta family protein [Nisaea sediminum]|uniref:beta family protein n=1 Tax=Nisaea sediminum TaxID=2775867 RepID=UPI00186854C5|nr:beta family protein [Nisaea sediminum]
MLPYSPCLRFKLGECNALMSLSQVVRSKIQPRFVIPSLTEHDPELDRAPTSDEIAYITGERVGRFWPKGSAFLDARFLESDLGAIGIKRLFSLAQKRNKQITPVIDAEKIASPVWKGIRSDGSVKSSIRLQFDEIDENALNRAMLEAELLHSECVVFLDFTGAPLEPELATEAVQGALDLTNSIGPWHRIVLQGSNFPERNPGVPNQEVFVPRHEWAVFSEAFKDCDVPISRIGYGDFGADCATLKFPRKKGGGRAIRHLRYTTARNTVVVCGDISGSDNELMGKVCRTIVNSDYFDGPTFSKADSQIDCLARRLIGPGNPSVWREWNMNHHITKVVKDLGEIVGSTVIDSDFVAEPHQVEMFDA